MNKSTARRMWATLLTSAMCGVGIKKLENPMIEFSLPGRLPEDLPDREYGEWIHGYMQQSYSLWNGENEKSVTDILMNALRTTHITDECLEKV